MKLNAENVTMGLVDKKKSFKSANDHKTGGIM